MDNLLTVRNMSISFYLNGREMPVVKNLSLDLKQGEILSIVGASGSGKSVFSHALMGILPKNATCTGEMTLKGAPLTPENAVKEMILVPQTTSYLDPLMKISKQIPLTDGILSEKSRSLYPFQCSGGMIRNALFSLVYEKDASIIIADEPTPGLDLESAVQALAQLKALAEEGKSVILITHDIDLAIHISHRVAVFHEGSILEIASQQDFFNHTLQHPYTKALFAALPQNNFVPLEHNPTPQCHRASAQLSCQGLSFRYPCKKVLFQGLDFSIKEGERTCLFARSGFGKSTFAKILSGYENPFRGRVLLEGHPLPTEGFSPVQLIYQHPELGVNPKWTVAEILAEGGDYDHELLSRFGIDESYLNRFPHELSGGELQRICIVRAMKPQTKFLICDEITTMLDAITQANIWQCILEEANRRNLGLLVITHNHALAHRICQQVVDFEELCRRSS